jgi:hypothetical protein
MMERLESWAKTLINRFGTQMTLRRVSSISYNEYDEAEYTYDETDVRVLVGAKKRTFVRKEDGLHEAVYVKAVLEKDVDVGKGDRLGEWVVESVEEHSCFKTLILVAE